MELTILGSGTCVPSKLRSSPGFLLTVGSSNVLFDSGPGTTRRLVESPCGYRDIDYIFYTHTHPDHVSDLAPILMAMIYTSGFIRKKPLFIFGPSGFREFFNTLARIYGNWLANPNYELHIGELDTDSRSFEDWHLISKTVCHSQNALGYRVEHQGKIFAYSGDTSYCENVVKIAKNADLALMECSFPNDSAVEGHLTPSSVSLIGKEAGCKKLLLTHMYPPCEEIDVLSQCECIFNGEIVIAEDLMVISI